MMPPDFSHLGLRTQGDREAWAVTSEDDRYRYMLGRSWDTTPGLALLSVVMLNPSKARHDVPDPTITRLIHFGKQEDCGGLLVRNLFGFSSQYPKDLQTALDPVGPQNAEILMFSPSVDVIHVAAWGNFPNHRTQKLAQRGLLTYRSLRGDELHVFGLNETTGEPKHPLYLPNDTRLVLWKDAVPS